MKLTPEQHEYFRTFGFLPLRGILSPDEARRHFGELDHLLRSAHDGPYAGARNHWTVANTESSSFAASLAADARFVDIAEQVLGRAVLCEGADASFYVGDTRWHHDAISSELFEAVKFTLYGDALHGGNGALRVIPGSHVDPLQSALAGDPAKFGVMPSDWPGYVFESTPGDAILFDLRTWHGTFGGRVRIAGSVNFRIDPRDDVEIDRCKKYFALSHRHFRARHPGDAQMYPPYWRSLPSPRHQQSVARMTQLELLDPPPEGAPVAEMKDARYDAAPKPVKADDPDKAARKAMLRDLLSLVKVVDDFEPDFEGLRRKALGADYKSLGGGILRSGLYTDYHLDDSVLRRIEVHIGYPLVSADPKGTGRFSLRSSTMTMGIDIHADSCLLGGILYLNTAEQSQGGTSVFRHKATGLYKFPTAEEQATLGLADGPSGYFDYFCKNEGLDRSKWDEVIRVEMKPNRLVLIAGGLFHSHTSVFGDGLHDGRLVQLYFLNPKD